MSFNWTDYHRLAKALQSDPESPGPEEASLRSAISRAYYATFCTARNFAETNDSFKPTNTGADHDLMKCHFQSSKDRVRRRIGNGLERLYDYRGKADYDDIFQGLTQAANLSVSLAEKTIGRLGSLSAQSNQ